MESMRQSVMYYNSYKLKVVYDVNIYILIMSHNGMASIKLISIYFFPLFRINMFT